MNDIWIYQGRQSHGWFGHGTGPKTDVSPPSKTNALFDLDHTRDRIHYVVSSIFGHVPGGERNRWVTALAQSSSTAIETAVAAWQNAASLGRDAFRDRLLDRYTSDAVVDNVRLAARGIVTGRTYQDLAEAGEHLSTAAQRVGVDRWTKFIADAADRAARVENEDRSHLHGFIRVLDTEHAQVPGATSLRCGIGRRE